MQDGIKLLIERMDQYPEEFFGDLSYRWTEIMQDIGKHGPEYLEEEDLLMLNKKVKEVRRKELNAKITEEIATGARLKIARERLEPLKPKQYGPSIAKQESVWWSGDSPMRWVGVDHQHEPVISQGVLDLIERGKDNATLQNIRATNAVLERQLAEAKLEIAQRDRARAQSYKKRSNQNWK